MEFQTTHTITIKCTASGDITLKIDSDPDRVFENDTPIVHYGENIKWECENKDQKFAIYFGWNSPFPKIQYNEDENKVLNLKVPEGTPVGVYKYTIAVLHGDNLWTEDPEFIIRP